MVLEKEEGRGGWHLVGWGSFQLLLVALKARQDG